MSSKKEDRPEPATLRAVKGQDLRIPTHPCVNYTRSHAGTQAQIRPGTEVFSVGWNVVFMTIGVGCAAKWFMSLLDKLEG